MSTLDSLDLRLVLGSVLVLALFVLAVAGPALAPYGPDEAERVLTKIVDGEEVTLYPPQPPSQTHWFGTDVWGYDILSSMLRGLRFTVLAALGVALARLSLGLALGVPLGLGRRRLLVLGLGAGGGVPAFIVVYLALHRATINSPLSVESLLLVQLLVLVVVGIPPLSASLAARVEALSASPTLIAAESLGARPLHLTRRHLVPLLREELVVLFLTELVLVLNLIGQLGIFHVFLGGTIWYPETGAYLSRSHEWAGLLGQSRDALLAHPWLPAFPLLGFLLLVVSVMLLLRGLEGRWRNRQQWSS